MSDMLTCVNAVTWAKGLRKVVVVVVVVARMRTEDDVGEV